MLLVLAMCAFGYTRARTRSISGRDRLPHRVPHETRDQPRPLEKTMSKNQPTRIEFSEKNGASNQVSPLGRRMTQLENRYTPLVVIAIIAILIGLLLPAI